MALGTKPRWDKYDGYIGNHRAVLAADVDLDLEANKVLAVGKDSDGSIVIGAGQTGIVGLMIVAVGQDIHGNLLDGGINNMAGDRQDVGAHGEITNFVPTPTNGTFVVTVVAVSGNYTVNVNGKPTGDVAFDANAATLKAALVAVDDGFTTSNFTVTGTAPDFTVVATQGITLSQVDEAKATVEAPTTTPAAGTKYYAHADGSVDATKGSDGVYVGHTCEADRLIVDVSVT